MGITAPGTDAGLQVDRAGIERSQFSSGIGGGEDSGGAECGALPADAATDPLLELVTGAWPRLTAEQRLAIVRIMATATGSTASSTTPASRAARARRSRQ